MTVVHVLSSIEQINFGIWNAALFASDYLKNRYSVSSLTIVCEDKMIAGLPFPEIPIVWAGRNPSVNNVVEALNRNGANAHNSIIVSHGSWLKPSILGRQLQRKGFRWLYVPHGMLEPWSIANNRIKKLIYFYLVERALLKNADALRAVSNSEKKNLEKLIQKKVDTVENGVKMPEWIKKESHQSIYLFMARLHFKKGVLPLVKAWQGVMKNSSSQLIIAGPDEGELEKIKPFIGDNIHYVGAMYGEQKHELLQKSHYYLLPSYSEGFATSVLEAMSYGLIPMISAGCNFPELFENELGKRIEPDEENIANALSALINKPFDHELSHRNYEFVKSNFSEETIGDKLFKLYDRMLSA